MRTRVLLMLAGLVAIGYVIAQLNSANPPPTVSVDPDPPDTHPTYPPSESPYGPRAEGPWPNSAMEFTGRMGSFGFNPYTDQKTSWWFHDVTMDGHGGDATLFAVGTNCRIERAMINGGKHGIRIASVNGLYVNHCHISGSSIRGHGIKLCGIGDRGPSSQNIRIENCVIRGDVAIRPMNSDNARIEKIGNVTLSHCTIIPHGNVGVGIAARNVWCENVTIDFREADAWVKSCKGFNVTNYYGCTPENVTITGNNRMLFRTGQTGELIVSDIPINR